MKCKKRGLAQSRGGRNYKIQKEPVDIKSLEDVQVVLVEALNETRSSGTENTVAKYRTIAYICLILANVQDRIDLEKRVEAIENSFMMTT